ncbi:uncharacterized protein JN550_003400 [Neoarthrinium moseri]|uniref:uncharacterized protein n=1 Tax=Neoarthrinium moseri TaxID=1658444 RepID=UPI001FDDAE98|nr:uncharacterized protein JN550_003400 [Neoarthrinium moseri]KAI1873147.1 hypothetical protein JN550_003400 [Neoarthrinium moseri]
MASREGASPPPEAFGPDDVAAEASETESGSSYAGTASAPDTPACPYRNSSFHDQECSLFHDCPTHRMERLPEDNDVAASGLEEAPSESESHDDPEDDPQDGPVLQEFLSHSDARGQTSTADTDVAQVQPSEAAVSETVPEHTAAISSQEPSETLGTSSGAAGVSTQLAAASLNGDYPREATTHDLNAQDAAAQVRGRDVSNSAQSSRPSSSASHSSGHRNMFGTTDSPTLANPRFSGRLPGTEVALPRWQPDSEVTSCPICHYEFGLFNRRHHCRKCGRVVCANCSPHRITIPHQYIVRAPGEVPPMAGPGVFGGERGVADFSLLGGGERVRLCNPCVPDPNTTPLTRPSPTVPGSTPQSMRSPHQRSQSSADGTAYLRSGLNERYLPPIPTSTRPADSASSRSRSATMHHLSSTRAQYGPSDAPSIFQRSQAVWTPWDTQRASGPQPGSSTGAGIPAFTTDELRALRAMGAQPRFVQSGRGSHVDSRFDALLRQMASAGSSSTANRDIERPLPAPPQIPEEDECPVCHNELPSRSLPNCDDLREQHIAACITSHSTYSPQPPISTQTGVHGTPPPRAMRRTGMFPYMATEKDCASGEECTICLEEYEPGTKMARLECLCRFHHACILSWFENHPGRCPVHQHDSFGY